jgi:WD40 repeat protein
MLPFAFTPEGDELILRTQSGVQFIDLQSGAEIAFLPSAQTVVAAALSPDGDTLAWSLADNTIQLLDIPGGELRATLEGHPDPVYHLKFSHAGDRLFSASHDGFVRIWDSAGNPLPPVNAAGEVVGFGVSPDDSVLATIPSDGPIRLWDLQDAGEPRELGGTGGYDTSDAHFSADGELLVADLATGLYLWRLSDGELVWNDVKNSMAVAYSPDGRHLAYSDVDDANRVFLASPDASQVLATLDPLESPIWEMFFSPNGSMLAATDGVEIRIWSVDGGILSYVGKPDCP